MKNAARILGFLLDAAARDEATALVTITAVAGSSPRAPGTHMAVSETGAFLGSLSGGCVEAGIVGEARRVIEAGVAESVRIGQGSRLIDLVLPCGGAMDLLITPSPPAETIGQAAAWLRSRTGVALRLGRDGAVSAGPAGPGDAVGWDDGTFVARHDPDLLLVIAGQGAETRALARLAVAYGASVTVFSPDPGVVAELAASGVAARHLRGRERVPRLAADPRTAIVTLFHDHDWETALLAQALEQDAFFVGAMGSNATQARRLVLLAGAGVGEVALERLVGPIGLLPAARDPETLALSVLAQIVGRYRAAFPES
jgi:xanthine dehydrogenase accessory factor